MLHSTSMLKTIRVMLFVCDFCKASNIPTHTHCWISPALVLAIWHFSWFSYRFNNTSWNHTHFTPKTHLKQQAEMEKKHDIEKSALWNIEYGYRLHNSLFLWYITLSGGYTSINASCFSFLVVSLSRFNSHKDTFDSFDYFFLPNSLTLSIRLYCYVCLYFYFIFLQYKRLMKFFR